MKQENFIGFRTSDEFKSKLRELAQANRRTLSDYCKITLEEKINEIQANASN